MATGLKMSTFSKDQTVESSTTPTAPLNNDSVGQVHVESGEMFSANKQANLLVPEQGVTTKLGPTEITVGNMTDANDPRRACHNETAAATVGFQEADINAQMNRLAYVSSFSFNSTLSLGSRILTVTSETIYDKIKTMRSITEYFEYARLNPVLRVVTAASVSNPGSLMIVWIPNTANFPTKPTYTLGELTQLQLFSHTIQYVHTTVSSDTVGFFNLNQRYATSGRDKTGRFEVIVYNQLQGSITVSGATYARYENSSLRMYRDAPVASANSTLGKISRRIGVTSRDLEQMMKTECIVEEGSEDFEAMTRYLRAQCDVYAEGAEAELWGDEGESVVGHTTASTSPTETTHIPVVDSSPVGDRTTDVTAEPATLPRPTQDTIGGTDTAIHSGWNKHQYTNIPQILSRPAPLAAFPEGAWAQGKNLELFQLSWSDLARFMKPVQGFLAWSGSMRIRWMSTATYATAVVLRIRFGESFQDVNLSENRSGVFTLPQYTPMPIIMRLNGGTVTSPLISVSLWSGFGIPSNLEIRFFLQVGDDFRFHHPHPWTSLYDPASELDSPSTYIVYANGNPITGELQGMDDVLGDIADVAGSVLKVAGVAGQVFGMFHKPDQPVGDEWTNMQGPVPSKRLSVLSTDYLPVDTSITQFTGAEMYNDVVGYLKHMQRIDALPFSATANPGDILGSFPVRPSYLPYYQNTTLTFPYWRGTINMTVQAVKTIFEKGAYAIILHPSDQQPTLSNFTQYYSVTVDISQKEAVRVDIPFVHTQDFLGTTLNTLSVTFMVINKIQVTSSPGVATIDLNVFVGAGDSMEFKFIPPMDFALPMTAIPNVVRSREHKLAEHGHMRLVGGSLQGWLSDFKKTLKVGPRMEQAVKGATTRLEKAVEVASKDIQGTVMQAIMIKIPAYALQLRNAEEMTDWIAILAHLIGDLTIMLGGWEIMKGCLSALSELSSSLVERVFGTTFWAGEDEKTTPEQEEKDWWSWLLDKLSVITDRVMGIKLPFDAFWDGLKKIGLIGLAIRGASALLGMVRAALACFGWCLTAQEKAERKAAALLETPALQSALHTMTVLQQTSVHYVMSNPEVLAEAKTLRVLARDVSAILEPSRNPLILRTKKELSFYLKWSESLGQGAGRLQDFEPVFVLLEGAPGVGKSLASKKLAKLIYKKLGVSEAYYSMLTDQDYHTMYYGQLVTIIDDLFQDPTGEGVSKLTNFISAVPTPMKMADIESKAQLFCSMMVIATANVTTIDCDWLRDPGALRRRFHDTHFRLKEGGVWEKLRWDAASKNYQVERTWSETEAMTHVVKHFADKWRKHEEISSSTPVDITEELPSGMKHHAEKHIGQVRPSGVSDNVEERVRGSLAILSTQKESAASPSDEPGPSSKKDPEETSVLKTAGTFHDPRLSEDEVVDWFAEGGAAVWDTPLTGAEGTTTIRAEYDSEDRKGMVISDWTTVQQSFRNCGFCVPWDSEEEFLRACHLPPLLADHNGIVFRGRRVKSKAELAIIMSDYRRDGGVWADVLVKLIDVRLAALCKGYTACTADGVDTLFSLEAQKTRASRRVLKVGCAFVAVIAAAGAGYMAYKTYNKTPGNQTLAGPQSTYMPAVARQKRGQTVASAQSLEDKMPALEKSIRRWVMRTVDGTEAAMNCVDVGGGCVLVPAHGALWGSHGTCEYTTSTGHSKECTVVIDNTNTVQLEAGGRLADMMMVFLGNTMPLGRSIDNYFATSAQLGETSWCQVRVLLKKQKEPLTMIMAQAKYRPNNTVATKYFSLTQECYKVNAPGGKGACGSLCLVDDQRHPANEMVIGILNAGAPGESQYVPVSREWVVMAKAELSIRKLARLPAAQSSGSKALEATSELQCAVVESAVNVKSGRDVTLPRENALAIPVATPENDQVRCHVGLGTNYVQTDHGVRVGSPTVSDEDKEVKSPIMHHLDQAEVKAPITAFADGKILTKTCEPFCVPGHEWTEVREVAREVFMKNVGTCRTLSYKEAVQGHAGTLPNGEIFVTEGINASSVTGLRDSQENRAWRHRRDCCDLVDQDGTQRYILKPEFQCFVEWWDFQLRAGHDVSNIYKMAYKDELRPQEKCEKGSVRVFFSNSFAMYLLQVIYLGDFVARFRAAKTPLKHILGCDIAQVWDALARSFKGKQVFAGDASGWDNSMNPYLMETLRELIDSCYPESEGRRVRYLLFQDMIWSQCQLGEHRYVVTGQKSGIFGTTELNSALHLLIHGLMVVKLHGSCSPRTDLVLALEEETSYTNGDDSMIGRDERFSEEKQMTAIREAYTECGVLLTAADKTDNLQFQDLTAVDFLKQGFKWDEKLRKWFPHTSNLTINSLLAWNRRTTTASANAQQALMFMRRSRDLAQMRQLMLRLMEKGVVTLEQCGQIEDAYCRPIWDHRQWVFFDLDDLEQWAPDPFMGHPVVAGLVNSGCCPCWEDVALVVDEDILLTQWPSRVRVMEDIKNCWIRRICGGLIADESERMLATMTVGVFTGQAPIAGSDPISQEDVRTLRPIFAQFHDDHGLDKEQLLRDLFTRWILTCMGVHQVHVAEYGVPEYVQCVVSSITLMERAPVVMDTPLPRSWLWTIIRQHHPLYLREVFEERDE